MATNLYIENYEPAVRLARGLNTKLQMTTLANLAVVAGGNTIPALAMGLTTLVSGSSAGIYFGSGAPSITAPANSLYIRTDGNSTTTRLYSNTTGSTVWATITTSA